MAKLPFLAALLATASLTALLAAPAAHAVSTCTACPCPCADAKPSCLPDPHRTTEEAEGIDAAVVAALHTLAPDGGTPDPVVTSQTCSPLVSFTRPAALRVCFAHEDSLPGERHEVGYFVLKSGYVPEDAEGNDYGRSHWGRDRNPDIDRSVPLFPDVSAQASGGGGCLRPGTCVRTEVFPRGARVGFFLRRNGYRGGETTLLGTNSAQRGAVVTLDSTGVLLVGLDQGDEAEGQRDFNDALLYAYVEAEGEPRRLSGSEVVGSGRPGSGTDGRFGGPTDADTHVAPAFLSLEMTRMCTTSHGALRGERTCRAAPAPDGDATVSVNGQSFALLDGTAPGTATMGCQPGALRLPSGWRLAPPTVSTFTALLRFPWGTECVALGSGVAYQPGTGQPCPARTQAVTAVDGGCVATTRCARVLLVREEDARGEAGIGADSIADDVVADGSFEDVSEAGGRLLLNQWYSLDNGTSYAVATDMGAPPSEHALCCDGVRTAGDGSLCGAQQEAALPAGDWTHVIVSACASADHVRLQGQSRQEASRTPWVFQRRSLAPASPRSGGAPAMDVPAGTHVTDEAVVVRGDRGPHRSPPDPADFALYLDVHYQDGTAEFGRVVPFPTGTYGWRCAARLVPLRPGARAESVLVAPVVRNREADRVCFDAVHVVPLERHSLAQAAAASFGDPHFLTFQRQYYDVPDTGEYTLVEDGEVTVQARFARAGPVASLVAAVGVRFRGTNLFIERAQRDDMPALVLNGGAVGVRPGQSMRLPARGDALGSVLSVQGALRSHMTPLTYRLTLPTGVQVSVAVLVTAHGEQYLDVVARLPSDRLPHARGLMVGGAAQDSDAPPANSTGSVAVGTSGAPACSQQEAVAEAVVTASTSIMHYRVPEGAAAFAAPSSGQAPGQLADHFSAEEMDDARAHCRDVLRDEELVEACVVDVLSMRDRSVAYSLRAIEVEMAPGGATRAFDRGRNAAPALQYAGGLAAAAALWACVLRARWLR